VGDTAYVREFCVGRRGKLRQTTSNFSETCGPQDNSNDLSKAADIFEQFFDKNIVQKIVTENNHYAE
jgi:hypothetical protein